MQSPEWKLYKASNVKKPETWKILSIAMKKVAKAFYKHLKMDVLWDVDGKDDVSDSEEGV